MVLNLELSEKLLAYIRLGNVSKVEEIFKSLTAENKPLHNFELTYEIDKPTCHLLEHHKKEVKTFLVDALLLNAFDNQDKLFLCAWKNGLNQTLSHQDKRKYVGILCGIAVQNQNAELYEIARLMLHQIFEPNQICHRVCEAHRICMPERTQQRRYH